mmetsp:Transcript_11316/g.19325  ORF Transcript_11316/g.19325 Transcript_11316/m.19325 type:complete len:164 (-) Transcript_11316:146-637(-)|eukprot:CAMPEP_0184699656 /NCGR_PEP_ID=MMETSP0313-20130426/5849_1 /TAXON_ID=2792 /ORGANISM="Porphyridium aerugineum, Strain SAG 1380-2" /LENGTH=163 /DNA_ID=CAMNT_0027158775 /DNA_START=791 /DNA_END=1282 /DNA_ORIENTATION=+
MDPSSSFGVQADTQRTQTQGVQTGTAAASSASAEHEETLDPTKNNRIQVSREKKPMTFFMNLAKKFLHNHDEVELSGLGLAISTVVTLAEILKNQGYINIKRIQTSLVDISDEGKPYALPKGKISVWIEKSANFDQLIKEEEERLSKKREQTAAAAEHKAPEQ